MSAKTLKRLWAVCLIADGVRAVGGSQHHGSEAAKNADPGFVRLPAVCHCGNVYPDGPAYEAAKEELTNFLRFPLAVSAQG